MVLISAVLAVAVVPFLLFGGPLEAQARAWLEGPMPRWARAGVVVGLLAGDVLLPVPSSVVNTFAGAALGFFLLAPRRSSAAVARRLRGATGTDRRRLLARGV